MVGDLQSLFSLDLPHQVRPSCCTLRSFIYVWISPTRTLSDLKPLGLPLQQNKLSTGLTEQNFELSRSEPLGYERRRLSLRACLVFIFACS